MNFSSLLVDCRCFMGGLIVLLRVHLRLNQPYRCTLDAKGPVRLGQLSRLDQFCQSKDVIDFNDSTLETCGPLRCMKTLPNLIGFRILGSAFKEGLQSFNPEQGNSAWAGNL